jgi:hypothetical protein
MSIMFFSNRPPIGAFTPRPPETGSTTWTRNKTSLKPNTAPVTRADFLWTRLSAQPTRATETRYL